MPNNNIFFNYEQPNSTPRMEMLIVIDFLQKEAYDEYHAAKQKDIIDYAKKYYGIDIRRDRIAQILAHLEEVSEHSPELLPFELGVVNLNATKKYYVSTRMFRDVEVVRIISAIKSDSKLSEKETKRLCDKFLDKTVSKARQASILEKVSQREEKVKKASEEEYKVKEAFCLAIEKKAVLKFKLKSYNGVGISSQSFHIKKEVRGYVENEAFGYGYSTLSINDKTFVVIYIPSGRFALITKYDNVIYIDVNEKPRKNIDYDIDDYDSIDEWVNNYFLGKVGRQSTFELKTTIRKQGGEELKSFKKIKESYEQYWGQEFKYEIKEREVASEYVDENGEKQIETTIVEDAYFSITSNYDSFRNWYENGIFDKVVILSPDYLNERILRSKIHRYARRIEKYGSHYNYEIKETLKPDYEEELKKIREERRQRREMIEKRRQEREAKLENK